MTNFGLYTDLLYTLKEELYNRAIFRNLRGFKKTRSVFVFGNSELWSIHQLPFYTILAEISSYIPSLFRSF